MFWTLQVNYESASSLLSLYSLSNPDKIDFTVLGFLLTETLNLISFSHADKMQ